VNVFDFYESKNIYFSVLFAVNWPFPFIVETGYILMHVMCKCNSGHDDYVNGTLYDCCLLMGIEWQLFLIHAENVKRKLPYERDLKYQRSTYLEACLRAVCVCAI
jgi:hypothetical protein